MNKNNTLALIALAVSLAVALFGFHSPEVNPDLNAGGTVENFPTQFVNGLYIGNDTSLGILPTNGSVRINQLVTAGSVLTVASGSTTYTAAQLCDNTLVRHNIASAPASAQNFTLPTAAALIADCLPSAGDTRRLSIENNSGSIGEVLTVVAGSGIDLGVASGSAVGGGKGDGVKLWQGARALVQIMNINGSSVSFDVTEIIDGD